MEMLFAENPGVILEVNSGTYKTFLNLFQSNGVLAKHIGYTGQEKGKAATVRQN